MINYVLMTADHVFAIAEIEKICFSDPWSVRSVESELENPLSLWLVALDGDCVVGYVGSQTVLGGADMMNLAVLPQYRKQGVGEALVDKLMDALRAKGAISLSLEVRQSNLPAICLYKKLGFEQIGMRPNYYRNPRENALILRKEW
jgi:ribosomal-protein-alanine N-acetyltransferase